MLVNLADILAIAEQNNMAVAAFNSPSLESVRAAIDAAEQLGYPVIIDHAQGHESVVPLDVIGPVMVELAERSSATVCIHLDHCEDLSYLRRALEIGFSGAMFDGSMLPYEENVANSRRAAEMCAGFGCGLECELGSMGARESGAGHEEENEATAGLEAVHTDPDQAAEFVASTGLDALACSFGTVHGLYKGEPKLAFDVLEAIRARVDVPLVMHGGSGVGDDDYHRAINAGIRKINYYTYGAKYAGEAAFDRARALRETSEEAPVYWHDLTTAAYESLRSTYEQVMTVFANGAKPLA